MKGGVGDYTRELGTALAAQGVEVHILTHQGAAQRGTDSYSFGHLQVHPLIGQWNWRSLMVVSHVARAVLPDVIHVQYQTAAYNLHPAVNFLPLWLHWRHPGVPTVFTYHDLRVPYLFPKAGPLRRWVTFLPARVAHRAITTNAEDAAILHAAGISSITIPIGANVHPVPVSEEEVRTWRDRLHIPPQATVLGYFGFLNQSKGVSDLIQALALLVQGGVDAHLVMMGEEVGTSDPTNRTYREEIRALIQGLSLMPRVHWTGFLDDATLSVAFASTDVVVLPYRDGASLRRGTLHAALVHGAAIITTVPRVPVPELRHGETVFLVPPADPKALVASVRRLQRDRALCRRLREGARVLAQRFSWESIATQHVDVYTRL